MTQVERRTFFARLLSRFHDSRRSNDFGFFRLSRLKFLGWGGGGVYDLLTCFFRKLSMRCHLEVVFFRLGLSWIQGNRFVNALCHEP